MTIAMTLNIEVTIGPPRLTDEAGNYITPQQWEAIKVIIDRSFKEEAVWGEEGTHTINLMRKIHRAEKEFADKFIHDVKAFVEDLGRNGH